MRRRPQRGFTLIEVLLAVSLLLGVATAVYTSMATSFETKKMVSQLNDRHHEARQVIGRMAKELRQSFLREPLNQALREDGPTMVTRFLGQDDELYFQTTAHLRLQAGSRESDQCEVQYFLRRANRDTPFKDGQTLYRRESKRLDDDPEKGGSVWPVIDGVKELKFEYWDDAKEIGDDAWQGDWDSNDNNTLPARIRITLVLTSERENGKDVRFVTQAAPRLRRPINPLDAR
ncbi:MAG: general secretion pathway protein J [Bradymonadia bacterium]|jgi:general secretion pathway protein J